MKKRKMDKSNALRLLDKEKINYTLHFYDTKDGKIDGVFVAQKIGKDPKIVYKTLVTQGASKIYYVFVIPVAAELDLKKAATAAGEKKVRMLAVKKLLSVTGYVRGGCSPIGMKKLFPTFLDQAAGTHEKIIVSGGKIGCQIEMRVADLLTQINGRLADLRKD